MITTLRGTVIQIEDNAVIVEIGGVGLRVFIPQNNLKELKINENIFLHTHMVVREDAINLYGFNTASDRLLFNMLLGVDGVGPKVALSVLSTLDRETIQQAVIKNQDDTFSRVPGVGRKTAQKIIIHLHDKLKPASGLEQLASLTDVDSEVLSALTALGYSIVEAQQAIQHLPKDAPEAVEERLRLALQNI